MSPALFRDVLASELTKLRTVRSTYWTVLAALVLALGLSALIPLAFLSNNQNEVLGQDGFDPTSISLSGLFFAQLALGVFGALTITAEYSSGMIRTSVTAVPRRGYVLAAKAVVATVTSLVVGEIISFAAFAIGGSIFASHGFHVSLSNPGVARAVVGGGLYVAALTLLALGLGVLVRSSAAAITVLVAVVFVIPVATAVLPENWHRDLTRYFPAEAGSSITTVYHVAPDLSPWVGFGVLCAWTAVVLVAAQLVFRTRDV